LKTKFTV